MERTGGGTKGEPTGHRASSTDASLPRTCHCHFTLTPGLLREKLQGLVNMRAMLGGYS
jgi:hypothetical protein